MNLFQGIVYNIRGVWFSLKSPKLLCLGLLRFAIVLAITILSASFILIYHQQILDLLWKKPDNQLILWLWHLLSWLLSFLLVGLSAVLAYLLSQIFFAVVLMDMMSRITERLLTGHVEEPKKISLLQLFLILVKQELPRATIPVLISILLMAMGWITPVGPILMVLSSGAAVIFLAWDNTDLVPARRLMPFRERFRFLLRNLPFHLGFGLPFLIPGMNIFLLSFAPVGGTFFHMERQRAEQASSESLVVDEQGGML